MTSTEPVVVADEDTTDSILIGKVYPSILNGDGSGDRTPAPGLPVVQEELVDILRATAAVHEYTLIGDVDFEVRPADPALFGANRVIVSAESACQPS